MRHAIWLSAAMAITLIAAPPTFSQQNWFERIDRASPQQLQALLSKFPKADSNRDGALTRDEAIAFARGMRRQSQQPSGGPQKSPLKPTHADVAYDLHERNRLDFWQADGEGARPLVIFIHGGGFRGGDKSKWHDDGNVRRLLDEGISCAAINYRFRHQAPIQDILLDAAHAVQFLRGKSNDWKLDPSRFAAWGGSAGAGTSLWLGCRDDLADPQSDDRLRQLSSRVQAVVLMATQATYDLTRWEAFLGPARDEWRKSEDDPASFYHLTSADDLTSQSGRAILRECDMLSWIDAEDAPVFVSNPLPDTPPTSRNQYLHHPAHAREIEKACNACGVPCYWQQSVDRGEFSDPVAFLTTVLKAKE